MKVENHMVYKSYIYKVCVTVFEGAEADYKKYNLPFRFLLWKF